MESQIRPLLIKDARHASILDKKWFGNFGISEQDVVQIVSQQPQNTLALVNKDDLLGFTIFEIVENATPPDYVGSIQSPGKILFIQQFTTATNYKIANSSDDASLLTAVVQKANEFQCLEIWEALSTDHPYKIENNAEFDAFGFYISQGFTVDYTQTVNWKPSNDISIPCYMFRKKLRK